MSAEVPSNQIIDQIRKGYTFEGSSIQVGVLLEEGTPRPEAAIRLPLAMMNRHGLVSGATGTGKTRTLQLLAEQLSNSGVAVFAADIKGDLSGMASPGASSDKLLDRARALGQEWQPRAMPVEFYTLGGAGLGVPIRATVSSFGPVLLSRVLELNDVQESSLGLIFHWADTHRLPLLDLSDLRAAIQYLTSDEGKADLSELGGVSKATAGVILRKLANLSSQGADQFFGEPEFDTFDLLRVTNEGRGIISLLELPELNNQPLLFSTFMMWLLADLYDDLPEVGDQDKPKLVFFLDEAHLLFADASKAFLQAITQTVRLIRSKGVGIFFVTQTPKDVPDDVLAQLGSRVQHQLRAFTPKDVKALKAAVDTFPTSHYDLSRTLQELGTGEAIVTVMGDKGVPTPVAWTRVLAPSSLMSPTPAEVLEPGVKGSPQMARYGTPIDRDSAREMLARRLEEGADQGLIEAQSPGHGQMPPAQQMPPRRPAPAPRGRPRQERSMVEKVLGSTMARQAARSAGREIVRSLFGTARRRRR